ncbi:MAG: hypothetical protein OER88_12185 [Planctomycetota bacterium]|nr:hypothetical protein [Planctomycetota bacterium]
MIRLALAALACALVALPAAADHDDYDDGNGCNKSYKAKKYKQQRYYDDGYARGDRYDRRSRYVRDYDRGFRVPHRVNRSGRYHDQYVGARWHRGHGHRHSVYRFPVNYRGHWVYRDHPYCGGSLYSSGIGGFFDYTGRRVRLSFGWN